MEYGLITTKCQIDAGITVWPDYHPEFTKAERQAYDAGCEASEVGFDLGGNPFATEAYREAWQEGFTDNEMMRIWIGWRPARQD